MRGQEISSEDIHIQSINTKPKQSRSLINQAVNEAIGELELSIKIINTEDIEQLSKILVDILSYPNNDLAALHHEAMRLGNFDLQQPKTEMRFYSQSSLVQMDQAQKICPCCGFIKQQDTIGICTSFDSIKNMGVSTYLYFATYKNLAILLTIMTLIYSSFALITNVIAANNISSQNTQTNVDYISISLSSKQTNDTNANRQYYLIQCWLGVLTIIIWIFVLIGRKYFEIKSLLQYDHDTISCSDYSVMMQGMPMQFKKDELQKQLNNYYSNITQITNIPPKWKAPLTIAKINIGKPFYLHQDSFKDQEIQNIDQQLSQIKQHFITLLEDRKTSLTFSSTKQQRTSLYEKYNLLTKKKIQKCTQLVKRIRQQLRKQTSETTTVFLTFQTNTAKSLMTYMHQESIFTRIKSLFGKNEDRFYFQKEGRTYDLDIKRAPQPQDIKWSNIGQKDLRTYIKKLFTFTVTIILLGVCFGIVYGLTLLQMSQNDNRVLSFSISITISLINMFLGQVIRRLTVFQKDYTQSYHQASLAIKSILAQMVNSILIPLVTAFKIKQNVYETSGLVDNIFMLSLSTSIIPPIMVLVNPYNLYMKIVRCYKSKPSRKLELNQKQYNIIHEGVLFQVGYQSIYAVNVFMFSCFFVSLQPIITAVALVGYFLMYWVEKYSLFNVYKRPIPGTDFVNNAIFRITCLGPLVFSFGSLTWSNLSPNGIPYQAIIPNLIGVVFSVIIFILPLNTILLGTCFKNQSQKSSLFSESRIFLPSQYDRLNPSTYEEGLDDYKKYMQRKKVEIQKLSQQQQAEIQKKQMMNANRGQMFNNNPNNFNFLPELINYNQPIIPNNQNHMLNMNSSYIPFNQTEFGYVQPQMTQHMHRPSMQDQPILSSIQSMAQPRQNYPLQNTNFIPMQLTNPMASLIQNSHTNSNMNMHSRTPSRQPGQTRW